MAQPGSAGVQPKTVEIVVSAGGTCSPDPAKVNSIDRVMWTGDCTDLHFPSDNPFDDGKNKKFKPNFAHKVGKLEGKFKYNVITPTGTYDPEVEIIPPPP